jgi:uncharacterized protein (TIGR02099 family)
MALNVRRAGDGRYYVGGIAVDPKARGSGFSDWVLDQRRVHFADASLTWNDDVRGAPPLRFDKVDFTLTNVLRRHEFRLAATPPADLATPLLVEGDLRARSRAGDRLWSGTIRGAVAGLSFPGLGEWLVVPHLPERGRGAFNLVLRLDDSTLESAAAGFNVAGVGTTLGEDLPELRLAQMKGTARWTRTPGGQRVDIDGLQFARDSGALTDPFGAGLAWGSAGRELSARNLDLALWRELMPALPVAPPMRELYESLDPRGRIESLELAWRGRHPAADDFVVNARFSGLSVAAHEHRPGASNLSGRIRGDARGGQFEFTGQDAALDLPAVFRESRLPLDSLQMLGRWEPTAKGQRIIVDEASFANADAAGEASGRYELIAGHPGVIDLDARLSRADGTRVYRYLPRVVGDTTVEWVRNGVVAGRADDVRLTLKGDLHHFPFRDGRDGLFRIEAEVGDGVLEYAHGWPRIDGISARLLFEGARMEIRAREARIYNTALLPVVAVIPDLHPLPDPAKPDVPVEEILTVDGVAAGPIQDFIRFSNFSPVSDHINGLTDTLNGNGPMRLALKLSIPLRHSRDASLAGRLSFSGNTLFPAGMPRIDRVSGDLNFTGESVGSRGISAQFLGGPLQVVVSTREGMVDIGAEGRATAAGLAPWLGEAWGSRLSGQTSWRGQILMQRGASRVQVESELVGLGSTLPAPLAKAPQQPLPLRVIQQPLPDGSQTEVQVGRVFGALWRVRGENRFDRGEIRFGGTAQLPGEPGLRLSGQASALALSDWAALLPAGEGADGGLNVSSIDLRLGDLVAMGRSFRDVRLQGRSRNGLLRTSVSGDGIAGTLTFRPEGDQRSRLSAQFRQLWVPAAKGGGNGGGMDTRNVDTEGFPLVDLSVEDFRLAGRELGQLQAVLGGSPQGLKIERLELRNPDTVLKMRGVWRRAGRSETRADIDLDVIDAGKALARFGFPDAMSRGRASFKGEVTWEGSPADFDLGNLAGTVEFEAEKGQFLKVDPGAAKLLGVLSLQSLPRRLSFDFRDIFSDGFAFDKISATMRIAQGIVYSDDFQMLGPAAKVTMSGLARLDAETVQLRVKVYPKLTEGVAVAGALIAGPLAGVGALAAQKILRDPIEEATSREYMVTGPWREPEVQRMTKPKAEIRQAE